MENCLFFEQRLFDRVIFTTVASKKTDFPEKHERLALPYCADIHNAFCNLPLKTGRTYFPSNR
jgi:hypothetical protein